MSNELSVGGKLAEAATALLNEMDQDTRLAGIEPLKLALEGWAMTKTLPIDTALRRAGLYLNGQVLGCNEVKTLRRMVATAQCYLVTVEVDYERPDIIKGFGCQADAEAFQGELEAYQRAKPAWPDDAASPDKWVRVGAAKRRCRAARIAGVAFSLMTTLGPPRWRVVLRMVCGSVREPTALLRDCRLWRSCYRASPLQKPSESPPNHAPR